MDTIKKYGTLFMSLGLFFIILHSVLPHNHSFNQKESIENQSKFDNIFDAIVNTDLGVNHLENLKNQDVVVIIFAAIFAEFNLYIENEKTIFCDSYSSDYKSQLIPQDNLHRGPPQS